MRGITATLILVTLAAAAIGGCGPGEEDKTVQQASTEMTSLGEIARAANGDFDKLSPEDKQKFLDRVGGNEQQARMMVQQMTGNGSTARGVAPAQR